ncbi:hypothetical protein [Chlorogloeopsis sp. ULAP02]|uniref:hypothetical protein n=1 Tax=Chlorogloeopsis sp. ULAP02 TaxID=3107926 RepID=UPI003135BE39
MYSLTLYPLPNYLQEALRFGTDTTQYRYPFQLDFFNHFKNPWREAIRDWNYYFVDGAIAYFAYFAGTPLISAFAQKSG